MRRRPKGEGYYWYEEATGQHRYRIRKGGKTHFVSDKDPGRARAKLRDLKKALDEGLKVDKAKQTFGVYARAYLENSLRVGESTAQDYGRRLGYYAFPWLKNYMMCDLSLDIGEAWVAALVRKGKAVTTISQTLRLVQRILDHAVSDHVLTYNPFAVIKPPRVEQDENEEDEEGLGTFTLEQEAALLADALAHDKHWTTTTGKTGRSVRGEGTYLLYLLALRLGLRRGELLGLRRRDIDLKTNTLRVRQQVVKMNGEVRVTKKLKTKAAKRDLPLTLEIIAALRPHLLQMGGGDSALLFPGRAGGPRHPDAVTRQFARTLKRLGISGMSLHDTRHTAITRWRERAMAAEVMAALAGHDKPDVTLEIYTAVTMERKRAALGE